MISSALQKAYKIASDVQDSEPWKYTIANSFRVLKYESNDFWPRKF